MDGPSKRARVSPSNGEAISHAQARAIRKLTDSTTRDIARIVFKFLDARHLALLWFRFPIIRKVSELKAAEMSEYDLDIACLHAVDTGDGEALAWLQRTQPVFSPSMTFYAHAVGCPVIYYDERRLSVKSAQKMAQIAIRRGNMTGFETIRSLHPEVKVKIEDVLATKNFNLAFGFARSARDFKRFGCALRTKEEAKKFINKILERQSENANPPWISQLSALLKGIKIAALSTGNFELLGYAQFACGTMFKGLEDDGDDITSFPRSRRQLPIEASPDFLYESARFSIVAIRTTGFWNLQEHHDFVNWISASAQANEKQLLEALKSYWKQQSSSAVAFHWNSYVGYGTKILIETVMRRGFCNVLRWLIEIGFRPDTRTIIRAAQSDVSPDVFEVLLEYAKQRTDKWDEVFLESPEFKDLRMAEIRRRISEGKYESEIKDLLEETIVSIWHPLWRSVIKAGNRKKAVLMFKYDCSTGVALPKFSRSGKQSTRFDRAVHGINPLRVMHLFHSIDALMEVFRLECEETSPARWALASASPSHRALASFLKPDVIVEMMKPK